MNQQQIEKVEKVIALFYATPTDSPYYNARVKYADQFQLQLLFGKGGSDADKAMNRLCDLVIASIEQEQAAQAAENAEVNLWAGECECTPNSCEPCVSCKRLLEVQEIPF